MQFSKPHTYYVWGDTTTLTSPTSPNGMKDDTIEICEQSEGIYCFGNFSPEILRDPELFHIKSRDRIIGIPSCSIKSIGKITAKKLNNLMLSSLGEANFLTLGT